jgi:glyoxylate/hydroxypyruvate reductase A
LLFDQSQRSDTLRKEIPVKSPKPGAPLCIYIENIRSRDIAYQVTEEGVREALAGVAEPAYVVERYADEFDGDQLQLCNVLVGSAFDKEALRVFGRNLRLIHCTSAGVEKLIPLDWMPQGCALVNSSGVHGEKAGEFGLLALLMLNDKIPQYATSQRSHIWHRTMSSPIRGKRVLIYGVGALGAAVAEKARLLGMEVWGIRRSAEPHPAVDHMFSPEQLDGLLEHVDFVVVTAPLTPQTRRAFSVRQFARIKPGSGLVNMARAPIVDYDSLVAALRSGRLSGAVLDVFETEPLPNDAPWWDVPNLSVIPHVSSDDPTNYIPKSLAIFADNVFRLQAGHPLVNQVDGAAGY